MKELRLKKDELIELSEKGKIRIERHGIEIIVEKVKLYSDTDYEITIVNNISSYGIDRQMLALRQGKI